MILRPPARLWVGWVGRREQNSLAPIFKVDVLLERTIHLDHDLVILESSDDFWAAWPAYGYGGSAVSTKTHLLRSSKWMFYWKGLSIWTMTLSY